MLLFIGLNCEATSLVAGDTETCEALLSLNVDACEKRLSHPTSFPEQRALSCCEGSGMAWNVRGRLERKHACAPIALRDARRPTAGTAAI
jgi:hypothetical protein